MKNILIICLFLLIPFLSESQTRDYRVVFDLTSSDTVTHKSALRWAGEVAKADTNAKVEVVLYGQSLDLVVKDRSIAPDVITRLTSNKNVSFKVCAVAMKAHNIDKSQLLPGVETVPDGIYEIISKQREGWGYIKAAR